MNKINKWAIISRFGIIGWWLYKHLNTHSKWESRGFIFKWYAGIFLILSSMVIGLFSNIWNAVSIKFVGLCAVVLSLIYGFWAENYFKE